MEGEYDPTMSSEQQLEQMPKIIVEKLTDGLGFGEGKIGVNSRLTSTEDSLQHRDLYAVETFVQSGDVLQKVEADDDGCPDGRGVFRVIKDGIEKAKSLVRAKVFGGGATMGVAGDIALGKTNGLTLQKLFGSVIDKFKDKKINFGVHTDEAAVGEKSGCGAIDNAPLIIANAGRFADSIVSTIGKISSEKDAATASKVVVKYQAYGDEIDGQEYVGKHVIDKSDEEGAVKKELQGPHLEVVIILNEVDGYTVDQESIRKITDGRAQAFVVDVWRLKQIANEYYDNDEERSTGFIGMLVYSLSTAGTLTEGDLPVYSIKEDMSDEEQQHVQVAA